MQSNFVAARGLNPASSFLRFLAGPVAAVLVFTAGQARSVGPALSDEHLFAALNGTAVEMKPEAGFIPVSRVWKSGDVLEFRFTPKLGRITPRNIHSVKGYDLIREGPLLLAARLPEQPADKNASPAALPLSGNLKAGKPGNPTLGETPLVPVYHLLDPAYDQTKGSWRQLLFPKITPQER